MKSSTHVAAQDGNHVGCPSRREEWGPQDFLIGCWGDLPYSSVDEVQIGKGGGGEPMCMYWIPLGI